MSTDIKHPEVKKDSRKVRGVAEGRMDERELRARVNAILNRHPAVGLAVGVVRDGRLVFFHGHGFANIVSRTPITADTVFRIGSITKTVTAIAVMQLWEQGRIDLDAPANDYLRAYHLIPAKASFRPATVRHLLTHTAGIPQVLRPSDWLRPVRGEVYTVGQAPPLAEYYHGGLRVIVEPGTIFAYTDHGFATLGQIVEDVSGVSLDRYFREHVFAPLGMDDSDLLRSERIQSRLATGYSLGSHGVKAVTNTELVTAAAGSIYSTPRDMARYLAALLGGGANEHGRVLEPATMAMMFAPHFQTDPRVAGMGLGFFRADVGGHPAVWHEGMLPAFDSQIWLAPDDGVGVMAFTNGARGAPMWMPAEVSGLLRQTLGVPDEVIRTDVPQRPELWGDLCGWYRLSAQWTDMQSRGFAGLGAEVFIRGGQLSVRVLSPIPALYRGFTLHPDDERDPSVFRIDLSKFGIGTARVVFSRDARGATTRVHIDVLPLWLEKQSADTNPRVWTTRVLGALALAAAVTTVGRRARGRGKRSG
ncbi:MAG TPA: serine hydrolase domain-containing protein [Ktedonobacterales bacterium]